MKKYQSSLHCWDSNPPPSEHESPLITTRLGSRDQLLIDHKGSLVLFQSNCYFLHFTRSNLKIVLGRRKAANVTLLTSLVEGKILVHFDSISAQIKANLVTLFMSNLFKWGVEGGEICLTMANVWEKQ